MGSYMRSLKPKTNNVTKDILKMNLFCGCGWEESERILQYLQISEENLWKSVFSLSYMSFNETDYFLLPANLSGPTHVSRDLQRNFYQEFLITVVSAISVASTDKYIPG